MPDPALYAAPRVKFPQYGPFARAEGASLWALLTTPEVFIKARVATELGLPAVAGAAADCESHAKKQGYRLDGYRKQFIGAVICALMDANGFARTGTKRAVPHPAFTKGEVYSS